jgi:hypothetical protein
MFIRLRHRALSSFLGMALLIGGCPKRRTAPRLVYVPAPPPAAAPQPAKSAEALAIEEPPPPAPPHENAPSTPAAPSPAHQPRRATASEPSGTEEVLPEPEESPPTVEVPTLEPRESREKESALRNQVLELQNGVKQQITQLEGAQLAPADRKTLEDARTFLAQSEKALEEGDLQRSLNLARKASLLATALGKERH